MVRGENPGGSLRGVSSGGGPCGTQGGGHEVVSTSSETVNTGHPSAGGKSTRQVVLEGAAEEENREGEQG